MGSAVDIDIITSALPGRWHISATNFPMWLDGSRRNPEFEYAAREGQPLAFDDRVHYSDAQGRQRTITGIDRWRGDSFVWRGAGALRLLRSAWSVGFLSDEVLVIHFQKSRVTPAGTDICVKAGAAHPELRRLVAADPAEFGLTVEQFASLTWLDHIPAR